MITIDDYSIEQYPSRNMVVISLPNKTGEWIDSFTPSHDRKKELTEEELGVLLMVAKNYYEPTGESVDEQLTNQLTNRQPVDESG